MPRFTIYEHLPVCAVSLDQSREHGKYIHHTTRIPLHMWWSCLRSQCSPQKQSAKHFSCHSSRKGRCMNMPFGRDYWTVTILRAALTKLLLSKFWRLHFGGTLRSPFSSWLVFMTLVTTATEHITDFSTFVLSNILQEPLSLLLLFHAMTKQLGWCVKPQGQGQDPSPHWPIGPSEQVSPGWPQHSPGGAMRRETRYLLLS